MSDPKDFSSFPPEQEKAFVPFERAMRFNIKRAITIGAVVAGVLLVVLASVTVFLYTPCTVFCARPPSVCNSPEEIARFSEGCEDRCAAMEDQSGLTIKRETNKDGETTTTTHEVTGEEWVYNLSACSFNGGAGTTCKGIVKLALTRDLWCPDEK